MRGVEAEHGFTTILALAIMTGLAVAIGATAAASQWAMARAQASMVADIAAVAAARQGDCGAAATAAQAHAATLDECTWQGVDVTVMVQVAAPGGLAAWLGTTEIQARARAGY